LPSYFFLPIMFMLWLGPICPELLAKKDIQVPISAVSTSSHSEQSSQARQSRWYCRNRWESRPVPNVTRRDVHSFGRPFFVSPPCWAAGTVRRGGWERDPPSGG